MRARREADLRSTTTTEARIDDMIAEAARLRQMYEIRSAYQHAPYFEVQAERFALLVVDTGILKSVDDDQMEWLRSALECSRANSPWPFSGIRCTPPVTTRAMPNRPSPPCINS